MIKLSGPLLAKFDANSKLANDLNSITSALAKKDATLWGPAASAEAAIRLNWIELPKTSQSLLPQLSQLTNWADQNGLKELILCGMGGSSLAPEVFAKSYGKKITVLDSTDPEQVSHALRNNLAKTVVVIGSKSGSTIETASQKLFFESELTSQGLNPKNHIVVVTDPGSPLDKSARDADYQVINADPNVGGRFSALSAFGLVPAALMGINVSQILQEAELAASEFTEKDSTAVNVATLLLEQTEQFIAFCDSDSKVPGLSDWIEQLVAESTGKDQKGRLPIVIETPGSEISGSAPLVTFTEGVGDLSVTGSLSEQFIFWEWVTALMGRGLMVDPFNQPNVTEAKDRTGALLDKWNGAIQSPTPVFEDELFAIYSTQPANSLDEALANFFAPASGYVAVMAYLNRETDREIEKVRELIAFKTKRPTTFGWGPRFLHSTGQFHKGGQQNGAFIQISADCSIDVAIPTKNYSFKTLVMAQALGDGQALSNRKYPLIRIHLKDRAKGAAALIQALKNL